MGKIIQLSKNVINQIAAGEVIERPFSVVKELVENSIDAGATKISVEVSNECRDLRVADNGSGIEPDDILLAFSKHATSKIKTGEDLYDIHTMGFRGEALASIISISKLTCTTRTKDYEYGTRVECENSEVNKYETGCAVGTIMEIRDLFYNLPARQKFLKSPKTEFAYISEFVQSEALIHPEISFELKNDGRSVLKTTPRNELMLTLKELFSADITSSLKEVNRADKLSGLKITGYVSSPDCTRASKKDYYLYVNKRLVKCPVFQKAIDTVYRGLIGSRYPFIVLNLDIPAGDVDVNVHPTKKEVKYKNPNQVFNFIYSSVDSALKAVAPKSEHKVIQFRQPEKSDDIYVEAGVTIADIFTRPKEDKPEDTVKRGYTQSAQNMEAYINKPVQSSFIKTEDYRDEDVIIGQYKKTYILIEKVNGLEIVDQHIAEERYIYEQLKKSRNIDCQLLFLSDIIEVSPSDKELLENNRGKLSKYGYEIDFTSETELIFRKVPQILSRVPVKEILSDILENIHGGLDNFEEKILITTSCKAAVKANTYLNQYQMEEIIRNWRTCENPETCPHGRPISHFIEHKDLAKFFQRSK